MEAVDVQAAPAADRKSPQLTAMGRLLLQGDVGQSSSSCCDFQSSREEQHGCATRNNPNSSGRQLQQHCAGEVGRLSMTRFEQQAEQLLQQEQGLQVDQILDLLGMLLKRQHPGADKEASICHEQQAATSLSAAGAADAKRQAQNNNALPANSAPEAAAAAARHWVNTNELAPHGGNGVPCGDDFAAGNAAPARAFLHSRRDSNSSVLGRSQQHPQEQQQQPHVFSSHSTAAAGGTTAANESRGSNSRVQMVGSKSGSQMLVEERRQQDQQELLGTGSGEWTVNCLQQQPRGRVAPAAAAAAAVDTAAFKEAGAENACRSNGSSDTACWVVHQPKSVPPSPPRLPLRRGASAADPLSSTAATGTRLHDTRQQQRQQLQHPVLQQQQAQQHQVRQQQLQVERTRSQQYLMEEHRTFHSQHAQHQHQQTSGQRQVQELQLQQQQQQMEKQLQRGEIDENLLNDETRHLLSRSLDVLMGDVNVQTLKDLLLRKVPVGGNDSRTHSACNAETSYSYPTHMTARDAASFDAAVLSLLQQQPQERREQQQHYPRNQQQPETDDEALSRNCNLDEEREQEAQQMKKRPPVGEKEDGVTLSGSAVSPASPAATVTGRDLRCSARSIDEESIHVTAAAQRQQNHLRKVQQRQMSQEQQSMQQQKEKRTGLKTDTAPVSSHLEEASPCYSVESPAKLVKNESANSKRNATAEAAAAAGAAGNKRTGAAQRQQPQQAEKKRGRATRPGSPKDKQGKERPSLAKLSGREAVGATVGSTAPNCSATAEQDEQESHQEARRVRLCAAAGRRGSFFESTPSGNTPPAPRWGDASLVEYSACAAVEGAAVAAAEEVGSLGYARTGPSSCENEQQTAAVVSQSQQQLAPASLKSRLQGDRDGGVLGFFGGAAAGVEPAEETVSAAAKERLATEDLDDPERHLAAAAAARKGQVFEAVVAAAAGAAEAMRARCCSSPLPYRNGKRRVQEPCELALAAAKLEQQGHTFTPPFYLHAPTAATSSSSGSSRCSVGRDNYKRSDATGGGEENKEKDSEFFNERDTATGEAARFAAADEQSARTGAAHEADGEQQVEDKTREEDEELEGESLTQQQLTLLKHIYSVLSQAEEYFSFKSALYQLHIKRHLKKCVSSLAAAAAANSASSDKDVSPHTAAGGNKHHRSPVHAGSTQSKAIRLFTSMPPIPINAVEQRALLSVRKHLQAGGGGGLLCQGDGVAQLLMEELDELLTSLVNKLLLIIVVKFQTCFIHAPARAQLREFLVSFVFPGDMPTQLLFRDHVQAVVHARIRHFRDSVGRTLRHQPPPSPPMTAASIPRSGTKRSNRVAAAASASSPANRETDEEGDEEEDKQKKQKLCEALGDLEERQNRRRAAVAALPAGRTHSCSESRKASSAPAARDAVAHTTDTLSHSGARAAAQQEAVHGRQSCSTSNERKASPASRSPCNKESYGGRSLSSSDTKETARGVGAFAAVYNRAAALGRDGGRLSRAGDQGSAPAASKTAAAGAFAATQRKGTTAAPGGPALANGCGSGVNGRTRGAVYTRRKRGAAAAGNSAETRSPSASSSRYGPAAATRRGGSSPSTDRNSSDTTHTGGGAVTQRQQQSGREAANNRRGLATTAAEARTESKAISGAATSIGRNPQFTGSGAPENLPQKDYGGGNLHKAEGGRRGERTTRGGPSAEVTSGRASPKAAQQRSLSPVSRFSHRNAVVQQQQLLKQQQVAEPRCNSGTGGEVAGRWTTPAVSSDETEESCSERGRRLFGGGAEGVWGRSGSRTSILSRGSTRESACDPLAWEQADGPRTKGSPPTLSVKEGQQCLLPPSVHMTTKQVVSARESVDSGGGLVSAANAAAGEKASVGEDLPWSGLDKGEEEDEATHALAAALGGAFDPSDGDSAVGAAGEVWEWLAAAAASKDEQQQEKLRQTLETLLNAWTTSGTNECRNVRGTPSIEVSSGNGRNTMGGSNGSNTSADGWLNFAVADFASAREKRGRPNQAEEENLNHFDVAGNAIHFSGLGMSGKDVSLPSPSSVNGPPSEASTSFPPQEERTPPGERSSAESADADVTRSLATTENSSFSRRGSAVCLLDESLRTGRAAATAERGATAAKGNVTVTEERGGGAGTGAGKPLRIPLPREANRAHGTVSEDETTALDGLTHNTIADFLLAYCKEDASAYEIATQLKQREIATSGAIIKSATTAASTSQEGAHAEAYVEPRLRDENLVSTYSRSPADTLIRNCTASNVELPAGRAEAVTASHSGGNSLAFSLSSLLTGSSSLPS